MRLRRSLLFVPADRDAKLRKAATLACDGVIIDLEDSVLPTAKTEARANALQALEGLSFGLRERIVRINALSSRWGADDVAALREAAVKPDTVVIPKVGHPDMVVEVAQALGESRVGILPQVETARGILTVDDIAASHPRVSGLFFGAGDLLAETGGQRSSQTLLYPRSVIAMAAAAAGLVAIDTPFFRLGDATGLEADARAAAELGFAGKAVIHPEQITVVNGVFTPSGERVAWARKVLEIAVTQDSGVWVMDGEMIDAMSVRLAERIMAIVQCTQSGGRS